MKKKYFVEKFTHVSDLTLNIGGNPVRIYIGTAHIKCGKKLIPYYASIEANKIKDIKSGDYAIWVYEDLMILSKCRNKFFELFLNIKVFLTYFYLKFFSNYNALQNVFISRKIELEDSFIYYYELNPVHSNEHQILLI